MWQINEASVDSRQHRFNRTKVIPQVIIDAGHSRMIGAGIGGRIQI